MTKKKINEKLRTLEAIEKLVSFLILRLDPKSKFEL